MGRSSDIAAGTTRGGGSRRAPGRPLMAIAPVAGLAVIALVACSAPPRRVPAAADGQSQRLPHAPIKVGYLLPLTGIFTKNGTSEQNGFKLGLSTSGPRWTGTRSR